MNIGERMKELIDHLSHEGLNGVCFYDSSIAGEPTSYYAEGRDFYPDVDTDYFDYDSCRQDFMELVRSWFRSDDPEVEVNIDGFNYVEVYHRAKLKEACDLEEAEYA